MYKNQDLNPNEEDSSELRIRLRQIELRRSALFLELQRRRNAESSSHAPRVQNMQVPSNPVNQTASNLALSEQSIVEDGFVLPSESEGLDLVLAKRARDHQAQTRKFAETVKDLNDQRLELLDQINSLVFERHSANGMEVASTTEIQSSAVLDPQASLIADVRTDITAGSMHSTISKVSVQIPAHIEQISALNTQLERTKQNLKQARASPLETWERQIEPHHVTASHIAAEEQRCRDLELEIQKAQEREMYDRANRQVMRQLLFEVVDSLLEETASEVSFSHSWAEVTASSMLISAASGAGPDRSELPGILRELQAHRLLRPETNLHTLRVAPSSAVPPAAGGTPLAHGGPRDGDKSGAAAAGQRAGAPGSGDEPGPSLPVRRPKPPRHGALWMVWRARCG
jgi:hypothetical protein